MKCTLELEAAAGAWRRWARRAAALLSLALPAIAGAQQAASRMESPAGVAAGNLEQHIVYDSVYRRERRLWVYTPPGYMAQKHAPYNLMIAFDGDDYRDTMPLPMILDTLLAGGHAPPFVAVLVDNSLNRLGDLANRAKFARYMGRQLIPWIRSHLNVTRDARRTIVTGSSAGGLEASYVALARPDLFGNVLSQSGAYWRGDEGANGAPFETLAARYAAQPKKDISFVLDVGAKETGRVMGGSGPVFIDASRRMRDVLLGRGYRVVYTEVPAGTHSPATWRTRLPIGIVTLAKNWGKR